MSLFGTSPTDESAGFRTNNFSNSRSSLFEDEPPMTRSSTSALFADDDAGNDSPWDMPTPRKQQTRADLIRNLIPPSEVPDSYVEAFDSIVTEDGSGGRISSAGIARALAAAKLGADEQARIMGIIAPRADGGEVALDRNQFNVFLALIGLAQEGEIVSLDGVDERRRNLPQPKLHGLVNTTPALPHLDELAAKPPQRPTTPPKPDSHSSPRPRRSPRKPSMDYPEDPWNTPDLHRNHNHPPELPRPNVNERPSSAGITNGNDPFGPSPQATLPPRTSSAFPTSTPASGAGSAAETPSGWGFFDGNPPSAGGFGEPAANPAAPFGDSGISQEQAGAQPSTLAPNRTIGGQATGMAGAETITVTLVPEMQGSFIDRHHVFEVTSSRRASKVVRRYNDFKSLLNCLSKRYPFRALPLLPSGPPAIKGKYFSSDDAFLENRSRGLARFLNTLLRHPVLGQDQLVIMFLTVPTDFSAWSKQASASIQDEFAGRSLPPGLEDSLPSSLEDLFSRTRSGVERSVELYNEMMKELGDFVKRSKGFAKAHIKIAELALSLTEASADTYATDTNDVPLINDGLQAMNRHFRTAQSLMEDESRAWIEGVLQDLKLQRNALVVLKNVFDRRVELDRNNIPRLERQITRNETKLAALRAKPQDMVKPGEVERVVEAIIKDKESIVSQHNRSVFVKECIRDELIYFQHTQYNISRWCQDWAQDMVKYSELHAENWRRLLDGLEGMPHGE